jgi:RecG-like helicase
MTRHIGTARRDRAQENIRKKILLLEEYSTTGVPDGRFVPKNMAQFRQWEDEDLELRKIGSPNTLDRLHNQSLKLRAEELIKQLLMKRRRKESDAQETDRLRSERNLNKQLIQDLANQLHSSEQRRIQSEQREGRVSKRLEEANLKIGELTRQLRVVVPLQSVG